ncbi:hypothetical protein CDAR_423901 [Caerostris darwini]|uniref:Uncharacterized protein n=1 Tax=Caerostris darwini TaxID=1538125 RepID=A0AAV4TTI3_9ARAC|nr:hypothetical protein CDAR_423901 [Caerostris darwini]
MFWNNKEDTHTQQRIAIQAVSSDVIPKSGCCIGRYTAANSLSPQEDGKHYEVTLDQNWPLAIRVHIPIPRPPAATTFSVIPRSLGG